jgi:hypothetical protein
MPRKTWSRASASSPEISRGGHGPWGPAYWLLELGTPSSKSIAKNVTKVLPVGPGPGGPQAGFSTLRYAPRDFRKKKPGPRTYPPYFSWLIFARWISHRVWLGCYGPWRQPTTHVLRLAPCRCGRGCGRTGPVAGVPGATRIEPKGKERDLRFSA